LKKENSDVLKFKYPKIKDEIIWRWDGEREEHIALVTPTHFWVVLNPVAAEIFRMCDGCHTVDRMVDVLKARHEDAGEEELRKDTLDCLRELERCGVLTDANKHKHKIES
jgi:hypothetical protein